MKICGIRHKERSFLSKKKNQTSVFFESGWIEKHMVGTEES